MSLVEARRVFSELKCGTFCFCRAIRFPRGHLLETHKEGSLCSSFFWFNRAAQLIKVVLSCSFSKSLFCFGGVLEHALMLGVSKNALLFHIIYIIKITLSQPGTSGSISSGFDEGTPYEKRNVLWLVSCPSALWLANSLNCVSVLPHPLPKQQVHQYCHSLA